jgi:hypothetical protein
MQIQFVAAVQKKGAVWDQGLLHSTFSFNTRNKTTKKLTAVNLVNLACLRSWAALKQLCQIELNDNIIRYNIFIYRIAWYTQRIYAAI